MPYKKKNVKVYLMDPATVASTAFSNVKAGHVIGNNLSLDL